MKEQGLLAKVKIGDWVFATEDMSPERTLRVGMVASLPAIIRSKVSHMKRATSNPFFLPLTRIG